MLTGDKVGLRARHDEDIPVLREELYGDVTVTSRAEGRAWLPVPPNAEDGPFSVRDKDPAYALFSSVDLASGELIGTAALWGIDTHNRSAHLGLGLLPSARGKGYGTDVIAVLCHYGFVVHGLQRLQMETLADNTALLRAADRNGFVREGVLRSSAWVLGEFLDQVILGLLVRDYRGRA
ncbi:N-acetyltransferase [Streptomyces triticagri]|uniref:N-acetyltransferase n=1 Tax=Streptomyces triticagri TaxID=2293568 RepID=A0A372LVT5_9ACTN|nr:GNAT family protein [Streptomyces triticagri]RFU82373.1 N-acetyltransferase [Streptomyces triticagri]